MSKGFQKGHIGFWKGKKFSKTHLENLSLARIGKKHSVETREKIRIKNIGNKNALGFKNAFGYRHTEESKCKMRKNHFDQTREKSSSWKGDDAKYSALHMRVRKQKGYPKFCEICKTKNKEKIYEWANLTGNFADITDYKRMCKSCHNKYDKKKGEVKNGKA